MPAGIKMRRRLCVMAYLGTVVASRRNLRSAIRQGFAREGDKGVLNMKLLCHLPFLGEFPAFVKLCYLFLGLFKTFVLLFADTGFGVELALWLFSRKTIATTPILLYRLTGQNWNAII